MLYISSFLIIWPSIQCDIKPNFPAPFYQLYIPFLLRIDSEGWCCSLKGFTATSYFSEVCSNPCRSRPDKYNAFCRSAFLNTMCDVQSAWNSFSLRDTSYALQCKNYRGCWIMGKSLKLQSRLTPWLLPWPYFAPANAGELRSDHSLSGGKIFVHVRYALYVGPFDQLIDCSIGLSYEIHRSSIGWRVLTLCGVFTFE